MLVAITTGLRASELAGLTRTGIHLGDGPHLECHGKGRKNRVTPLLRDTAAVLAAWLEEDPGGPGSPLFPTRRGTPMSQNAIEDCIKRRRYRRSNLAGKHPTPHILRHTCAVRMLHSGIDITVKMNLHAASTCTTWPGRWSSCSATTSRPGCKNGLPT